MAAAGAPRLEVVALLVGVGVAAYLMWKAGNLTTTARNAAGQRVTAYEGAGAVGTLGAAANAASGGYLATLGQWLGGAVFDITHPGEVTPPPAAPLAAVPYVWGFIPYGQASFSDLAAPGGYLIRD